MMNEYLGASSGDDQALAASPSSSLRDLDPSGFDPSRITLCCPKCGITQAVDRDEGAPPTAVRAELSCPECWDGDRDAPEFFDASGAWPNPVEYLHVRGAGWRADCPKCVGSKFTCDEHYRDSDRSGEADETRSGSAVGESAAPEGIAKDSNHDH